MKLFPLFWTAHRWVGITAAVFALNTSVTGFMLLLKKESHWIQPTEQRGSASNRPAVEFPRLLEALRRVPQAQISGWEDVDRLDVRPARGILKAHDAVHTWVMPVFAVGRSWPAPACTSGSSPSGGARGAGAPPPPRRVESWRAPGGTPAACPRVEAPGFDQLAESADCSRRVPAGDAKPYLPGGNGMEALVAGRVQQLLGKPPRAWDLDDLAALVRDHGIRLVTLMHVGADGWLKALDFLPRDEAHLRTILSAGERADGSSLFASVGIAPNASDIVLRPRLHTAFLHPFSPLPTLAVLCEHRGRDGAPLPESPQSIVSRAETRLRRATGVDLWAHGEVEYFLGKKAGHGDVYGSTEQGYHATTPFVFGEDLRRQAMGILGDIGVPLKYAHSEVGYIEAKENDGHIWEQHEVELALAPLPEAADAVILTQWVLRNLAHAQGFECRFDPMLQRGHAGSGLHFHFSPCRDGVHLDCMAADGRVHTEAAWLIAGLVRYGAALMAFGNRVPASFQRLSQGKEVPRAITWGRFDRQALVRLPVLPCDEAGRSVVPATVEFRLPDGSVHPHLLLAGVAQAMAAGREDAQRDDLLERSRGAATGAPAARGRDAARATQPGADAVPRSFQEVGVCLARDRGVFERDGIFPRSTIDAALKSLGWEEAIALRPS